MAMTTVMHHPTGKLIEFHQRNHRYICAGKPLRSVSQVLNNMFPFDSERVSKIVAQKQSRTQAEVLNDWRLSAVLGKNVHSYIESLLLRRPVPTSFAETQGKEEQFFPVAKNAVERFLEHYEVIQVEQIIGSPSWGLAGTIDILARNRRTGGFLIGDWKTSSATKSNFRYSLFDDPCPAPVRHLANNKTNRYAMQILLYGEMLRREQFSRNFGKAIDALPLEYGLIQMGPDETGTVSATFTKVTPDMMLPPTGSWDASPQMILETVARSGSKQGQLLF